MAIPHVASKKNVTRFPNGITNVSRNSTLGNMSALDPTRQIMFFDDFITNPDITAATPNGWTFTTTNSGTLTGATTLAGGVLISTTGATSTNYNYVQPKEAMFKPLTTEATGIYGQDFYMKFAFNAPRVTTATHDQDILLGCMVVGATPLAANTQGVFVRVTNGANTMTLNVSDGTSTHTSASVLSVVYAAGVYTSIGIWYDPYSISDSVVNTTAVTPTVGCIRLFINDVLQPIKMPITYLSTGTLTPTIANVTNSANAGILNVDYFFAAQERLTYTAAPTSTALNG